MPKLFKFSSKRKATRFNSLQFKERFCNIYFNASIQFFVGNYFIFADSRGILIREVGTKAFCFHV